MKNLSLHQHSKRLLKKQTFTQEETGQQHCVTDDIPTLRHSVHVTTGNVFTTKDATGLSKCTRLSHWDNHFQIQCWKNATKQGLAQIDLS